MGLMKVTAGHGGPDLLRKDHFSCGAMTADSMMVRGIRKARTGTVSHSTAPTAGGVRPAAAGNVVTPGAVITVAENQCMLIAAGGEIAEFCAVPGEYVWDSDAEPSFLRGRLSPEIQKTWEKMKWEWI